MILPQAETACVQKLHQESLVESGKFKIQESNMQMKKSEIFDRWTILLQKARFNDLAKQELETIFDPEIRHIIDGICNTDIVPLLKSILKLQESNAKIWILEASIRKEFANDPSSKKDLTMAEVGERALSIRDHNTIRIQAKKEIDSFFGEISDEKVNHASSS